MHARRNPARSTESSPFKWHAEDLQHEAKLAPLAAIIRDRAVKRSLPQMTGHALEAAATDHLKGLTTGEVYRALKHGKVIEVNDGADHNDCRFLVRDEHGVCVVYSVRLHRVVTCWWNDPTDRHSTLDMSKYQRLRPSGGVSAAEVAASRKQLARTLGIGLAATEQPTLH